MLAAGHVTGSGRLVRLLHELARPVYGNALERALRIPHVDVPHPGVGVGRTDRDRKQTLGFAGGGGGGSQARAKSSNVADVMVGTDG